jgi:lipid II:glycine glycyltransferase (peptidoglycan interpeptide bridge formation enzyme)
MNTTDPNGHEEPEVPIQLSTDTQTVLNHRTWDTYVANHPAGHLLQTWAWGELKARFGWRAVRLALVEDGRIVSGAQVLFRPVPPVFNLAYVPKGPLVDWTDSTQVDTLLAGLRRLCRSQRSAFLKIEPHASDDDALRDTISQYGGATSQFTVQPPRTIVVDITPPEEAILAAMKQKTRYNIRLAMRKGVTVRPGTADDLPTFYRLMQITGQRDHFGIHGLDYFSTILELFGPKRAALLLAEVQDEPVAGLMVLAHRPTAYYLYGASSDSHRDRMPTYLLQWEAMRWARANSCQNYDLWGIPDADEETLEAEFVAHSRDTSGLWGVYRFKRGFGGRVTRAVGAFDFVYNRPLYWVYRQWTARRQMGVLT